MSMARISKQEDELFLLDSLVPTDDCSGLRGCKRNALFLKGVLLDNGMSFELLLLDVVFGEGRTRKKSPFSLLSSSRSVVVQSRGGAMIL